MTDIRKVPLGAGAEWLLGSVALLRKAPLTLGLLGLIWGGLSTLASLTGQIWLSLLFGIAGPILFGGIIYAAREVDQGRPASPAQLLQGLHDGKATRLLAMLLPQMAALAVLVVLLVVMVGPQQLQQISQVMVELQTNPDPALMESLPVGRLFGWMLAALVVGVVAGFSTFIAIPEVMFTDRGALAAMGKSLRACLRNLGAMIVLMVLMVIAMIAFSLALQLVGMLLTLVVGAQASMFAIQVLLMAVLLPVMSGAAYLGWRQMTADAPALPVASANGFEA